MPMQVIVQMIWHPHTSIAKFHFLKVHKICIGH